MQYYYAEEVTPESIEKWIQLIMPNSEDQKLYQNEYKPNLTELGTNLYKWAKQTLPPTLGLGLLTLLKESGPFPLDTFFAKHGYTYKIYWTGLNFIFIPTFNGTFLISPLSWSFAMSFLKMRISVCPLRNRASFRPSIVFVGTEQRLFRKLKLEKFRAVLASWKKEKRGMKCALIIGTNSSSGVFL